MIDDDLIFFFCTWNSSDDLRFFFSIFPCAQRDKTSAFNESRAFHRHSFSILFDFCEYIKIDIKRIFLLIFSES